MKKIVYHILALSLGLTTACKAGFENDLSTQAVDSGKADFTTYVALGNSLTAGYQDGALFRSGQLNAYPAILAKQMDPAGRKGEFKQPLMNDDQGGLLLGFNKPDPISHVKKYSSTDQVSKKFVLVQEKGRLVPELLPGPPGTAVDASYTLYATQGPFNNMGVPGAKSYNLTASTYAAKTDLFSLSSGRSSPYFIRMASAENASILGDALKQKPSFFSLWIGSNDVLLYALAGGASDQITPPQRLATSLKAVVKALTAEGAKGVVANIPAVTSIPYFTTLKWNDLSLNAVQAQALGPFVKAFNQALGALQKAGILTDKDAALRKLHYAEGKHNPFLIVDTDLEDISSDLSPFFASKLTGQQIKLLGQARPAQAGDFIVLKALKPLRGQQKGGHLGATTPLGDELVLTQAEAQKVATATAAYNQTIKALADKYGLAFVDTDAKLRQLAEQGIRINGNSYTAEFVKGGAFSLDGIHPNARGYAIVANAFIKAINARYGSSLPQVDPNAYPGIVYP